jgi:RNA polymerase sigma factor (sigma-70 family)
VNNIDLKIIESIRAGSNDRVLAYLYDKPLQKIRKYILNNNGSREDASDIFQDAVVILFNQVKKGKYDERYEVDGFLYSVARNLWIDRMRREKKIVTKDFIHETDPSDFSDHLKDLIVKEKSAALRVVFERLDDKCKKILLYVIYEKLNMKEISEKMGYSNENVAKSNHYRCKQYLSKMVKEDKELLNLLRN